MAISNGVNGAGRPRVFAFYCSGHGFGHATRVTALALHLLSHHHIVKVVTNAPAHVFDPVVAHPSGRGSYRRADIDAGVVQPKAYDVDRRATLDGLTRFMDRREERIREEHGWLVREAVQCVLVDSTFLPCAAAQRAGVPAVIISNFTFSPCYSFLSAPPEADPSSDETPIDSLVLSPIVSQVVADYACATLLLRLPGAIPVPSFDTDVALPATGWVDYARRSFTDPIQALLARPVRSIPCNTPPPSTELSGHRVPRRVVDTPLIVRPPSRDAFSASFRQAVLESMGVPSWTASDPTTKVLLVSFGGQSIPRPGPAPTPKSSRRVSLPVAASSPKRPDGPDPVVAPGDDHDLLPPGWIAIGTGLSGSPTRDLPPRFYAPDRSGGKDVYVPDLTAVSDVVLGKLGYGTCSETVSTRTPFVYVPRPLFVEEYGLKRLMASRGTAVEMSRLDFEAGRWADYVVEAWQAGRKKKDRFRKEMNEGRGEVAMAEELGAAGFIEKELETFLHEWERAA